MFQDRDDAGRQLAEKLKKYGKDDPIILALPRGGVPIGYRVSQILKAPLDVFIVRKIGSPWNPELGVGSVAPDVLFLDEDALQLLGLMHSDLKEIIVYEQQELKRRLLLYRGSEDFSNIVGQTVILVDDGIATGVTTRAAIQGIQRVNPKKLILAVPVAPLETVEMLKKLVYEIICLETPTDFYAVGAFYQNFSQVSDEEVMTLLKQAKQDRKEID
jgi:predicted phosphoribosyltransferase